MELAQKYIQFHSPGNRYAYYPSTKNWQGSTSIHDFHQDLALNRGDIFNNTEGHLYLHLPFCRSLCTFCGCNIKISNNKEEHLEYIKAVEKDLELKDPQGQLSQQITAFTFGGGSPNALHPLALEELAKTFAKKSINTHRASDFLCEIDPTIFTSEQKGILQELGVTRFSLGVQDFDEEICKNVNRHQSLEKLYQVKKIFGETPFGIDLIYSLPKQKPSHIESWREHLKEMAPHWVSLYPMAEVPWLAPYQEAYGEFIIPQLEEKAQLFETAHLVLTDLGYIHMGFGHYLAQTGSLYESFKANVLFRSVSGLYPSQPSFTLALGVGAISEFSSGLHQNERILERYKYSLLKKGEISTERFHLYSKDQKDFIDLCRQSLRERALDQDVVNKFRLTEGPIAHWLGKPNRELSKVSFNEEGLLFLKNIFQVLESRVFGL